MNDEREQEDSLSDIWITNWEQQCVQHLESEPDYEGQLNSERDLATQKAWCYFQNAAASIAQLYKGILFIFEFKLFYNIFALMNAISH